MSTELGNQDKAIDIDAIAEQWVNLMFMQLEHEKTNKKENKYEQSTN